MTSSAAAERPRADPPAPRWDAWIAVALETAIVLTFFSERAWLGLLWCLAYARFSATWAVVTNTLMP